MLHGDTGVGHGKPGTGDMGTGHGDTGIGDTGTQGLGTWRWDVGTWGWDTRTWDTGMWGQGYTDIGHGDTGAETRGLRDWGQGDTWMGDTEPWGHGDGTQGQPAPRGPAPRLGEHFTTRPSPGAGSEALVGGAQPPRVSQPSPRTGRRPARACPGAGCRGSGSLSSPAPSEAFRAKQTQAALARTHTHSSQRWSEETVPSAEQRLCKASVCCPNYLLSSRHPFFQGSPCLLAQGWVCLSLVVFSSPVFFFLP